MKKLIAFIAVASMLTFASVASAGVNAVDWLSFVNDNSVKVSGDAANGVVFSRHNLSSYGAHWNAATSNNDTYIQTTQICLFCHTSHHTADNCGPLSNRDCSEASSYETYTAVYDKAGKSDGTQDPKSSSLLCLSCHDGTQAVDMLINQPGSGSSTDGGASEQGWFFDSAMMGDDKLTGRVLIGTDLTNDHPIGMEYPGHTTDFSYYSLRPKSTIISSIDMFNANTTTVGLTTNLWAVAGYICGDCSIDDLLFGSDNTVECCTCHDPHFKNITNTDPGALGGNDSTSWKIDGLFFRRVGANSNSGVCRTCHAKG